MKNEQIVAQFPAPFIYVPFSPSKTIWTWTPYCRSIFQQTFFQKIFFQPTKTAICNIRRNRMTNHGNAQHKSRQRDRTPVSAGVGQREQNFGPAGTTGLWREPIISPAGTTGLPRERDFGPDGTKHPPRRDSRDISNHHHSTPYIFIFQRSAQKTTWNRYFFRFGQIFFFFLVTEDRRIGYQH